MFWYTGPYLFLWIAILVLDVLALVSILAGTKPPVEKLLWSVLIILLPIIGLVLYFFLGRDERDKRVMTQENPKHEIRDSKQI